MAKSFAELDRVLEKFGGFWSVEDILDNIEKGTMQSFAEGDTWVITQVFDFPRKKVLDITLVYGDLAEARELESKVEEYGRSIGAELITATGRLGWTKELHGDWKILGAVYIRGI